MLEKTGYRQMLVAAGPEEAERLENLDEFKSGILEYLQDNDEPTLTGFLEETALVADVDRYDETADAVVMMTVHSAKGLEFPVVFLPGMEEGLFPGMQTITEGQSEMEEERRLAYVAITRAKKELCILHTRNRLLYGQTMYNPVSRFVSEIPEALIEKLDEGEAGAVRVTQNRYGGDYGYGQYGSYGGNYNSSVQQKRVYVSENATRMQKTPAYGKPATPTASARPTGGAREVFAPGDRVKHLNFGEGEILSVKSMGADTLYEIMFDTVGTKKLMATYAKLKKL
jgi:DNA helicase-2/ATP-dependent DNA helicase PcrA